MVKKTGLVMVLLGASALPAMAQGANCTAPIAPVAVDGTTATIDQLRAGIAAAKAFIASSDSYQDCLKTDIATQKAAATKDKPFDPAIEQADVAKGNDNQAMKEKVGTEINGAIGDFKKAHPN